MPSAIRTIAVTKTNRNITPRQILLALQSGFTWALDKRFLDPDRIAALQAQGQVLPDAPPVLEPQPLRYVGSNRTTEGVRAIDSHPTRQESTSLVVLRGLDVMIAWVSPAGSFDQHEPSFLLLAALSALLSGTIGAWVASRSRLLQHRWR